MQGLSHTSAQVKTCVPSGSFAILQRHTLPKYDHTLYNKMLRDSAQLQYIWDKFSHVETECFPQLKLRHLTVGDAVTSVYLTDRATVFQPGPVLPPADL